MTQIAIERKSRGSWLLWLIVALVAIGLIWWLLARDRDGAAASGTPTMPMAASTPAETGTITGLSELYTVTDTAGFTDRAVAITDPVRVLSVTGDKTFWVGEGVGQQVLVRLDEVPTPNQPTEGRYDVTAGQTVRIWGDVRGFPGYEEAARTWRLNPNVRTELENQRVYIHANRLEIVTRP